MRTTAWATSICAPVELDVARIDRREVGAAQVGAAQVGVVQLRRRRGPGRAASPRRSAQPVRSASRSFAPRRAWPGPGRRRGSATNDQSPPVTVIRSNVHRSNDAADELAVGEAGLEERAAGEGAVQEGGVGVPREVEPAVAERALGEDGAVVGGLGEVDADEARPGCAPDRRGPRRTSRRRGSRSPCGRPHAQPCSIRLATPGGHDHRVVGRGERRRVGQVGAGQLLGRHPRPDGGREDVDPLAAARSADDLGAEQQPRAALADAA